jgi:pentatricopeptide repeat protein
LKFEEDRPRTWYDRQPFVRPLLGFARRAGGTKAAKLQPPATPGKLEKTANPWNLLNPKLVRQPDTVPASHPPAGGPPALTETVQLGRPQATLARPVPLPAGAVVPASAQVETSPRQLSPAAVDDSSNDESGTERAILLGAARNAVKQGNFGQAIERYEEFLIRFGDDPIIRQEYAGVLITANRLRKGAEQYRQLIARQPNDPALRVFLANIYVAAKEYRQAIPQLRRALELSPDNLEIAAKLAQVYTFDGDVTQALQVYDRYLAQLRPGDERVPPALGALLLDLGRPGEALPLLLVLLEKHPDDLEIRAGLVRCYGRLGELQKAIDVLKDMATKAPRVIPVRQGLAEALYESGDYELADLVYRQILEIEPSNGFALVGTARVRLQLFQPQAARTILEGIRPTAAVRRIYWTTWAEYHQAVGEYTEARQIYADLLSQDGADYEVRLALAALDDYICEYEKAKAEYSKVPANTTPGRKARLGFAAALFGQRFFDGAIQVCKQLLAENPADGNALALLVRSLAKAGHPNEAETVARVFLESHKRHFPALFTVRLALGQVLLDAGKFPEAAREYEVVLSRPENRIPVAYYGLARAYEKMGAADKAAQTLAPLLSLIGGDARNRLLLADLYAADNNDAKAVEMIQAVLKFDPENLAALIRLADAQQRIASFTAEIEGVCQTTHTILALSPNNVRALLALARARATIQDYQGAAQEYDRLILLDPEFTIPKREKARVLFSDHDFDGSAAAYQQLLVPSADERLTADLAAYASREPRARTVLEPYLQAALVGPVLRDEAAKAASALSDPDGVPLLAHPAGSAPDFASPTASKQSHAAVSDPEVQAGVQRILADYDARSAEQNGAHLEAEAKCKKDFRNFQAIPVYQDLIAAEPGNTEAIFDLGQVYGSTQQTLKELPQYNHVLQIEPQHRESMIAAERAGLELQPRSSSGIAFVSEHGRGGLVAIERTKYFTSLAVPYGDEDEYVGFGFARARYQPRDDRPLDGNILSVELQKKCDPQLKLFALVNFEEYEDRLHDRVTCDAGVDYCFWCGLHTRLSSFLENVVENGECLRQDIYRLGVNVATDYRPSRIWAFGGDYRYAHYSDNNDENELYLFNEVLLTFAPNQLKLVADVDFQSFAQQTVYTERGFDSLVGVIHPYFSPRAFAFYEARIEWTQWCSRDYFVHSNQCWYSLQYGLGWDSRLANYNTFRVLGNWDIKPWLTVGVQAQQTLSPVYNVTGVLGYLTIRFPCHLCR